jgi:hypothetical protein
MTRLVHWRMLRRPITLALFLLLIQVAYRAWEASGSGWLGDDFVMIDRTYSAGGHSVAGLLGTYAGHVIPGALYVTWLITHAAPYDFALAVLVMLFMQVLAALGLLRFLIVAFGERWGILPPFVLYLVSPLVVQSTVWWTPGSHHFVFHAALAWAMASQVVYLRTGQRRSALAAVAWIIVGLIFFEKSLLIIGALLFLTLAYFTAGSAVDRVRQLWQRYRFSLFANVILGVAYLAMYGHFGLRFSVGGVSTTSPSSLGPVIDVMVLRTWATGIFGGPLTWQSVDSGPLSIADPPGILILVCLACLVLLTRELVRTRTHALRALILPAYFLLMDVVMLSISRAAVIGPGVASEFRYMAEVAMATSMALALATMPVRGAVEQVEVRRPGILDRPRFATWATVAVSALAIISTTTYVLHWHQGQRETSEWIGNLFADARKLPKGAHVVDAAAPEYVAWPISKPANLVSHLVRPLRPDLEFGEASTDRLRVVDEHGRIRTGTVTQLRTQKQTRKKSECAYRVARNPVTIPLNDHVQFPGLWVRIGYLATGDSAVTVRAGGASYDTSVRTGVHDLYLRAGEQPFDAIEIDGLVGAAELCTDDVVVGQATPGEGS